MLFQELLLLDLLLNFLLNRQTFAVHYRLCCLLLCLPLSSLLLTHQVLNDTLAAKDVAFEARYGCVRLAPRLVFCATDSRQAEVTLIKPTLGVSSDPPTFLCLHPLPLIVGKDRPICIVLTVA